ncbi:MAG TPA: ABC transporter substrate-binding protein [Vicinamibacteria bacterium]|nr:ABC transporter substrate-binding protein [Vicinamibacteria bacterium]
MRGHRRAGTAGALLAALALAAMARAALGPRYGGDLAVAALSLPAALDPAAPRGSGEALLALLVHERLLRLDTEGEPRAALVRDWFGAAGGREWVLRLEPHARFHDGHPVTAEDARRSLRRFLRSPSPAAARLADTLEGGAAFRARRTEELAGLVASGAEVVLRFLEPVAVPLAPLAAPSAAVLSAGGSGAGPFVPTARVSARRLALTAFGAHVRGRPLLDRVTVVAIPRADELEVELQTRRVSLVVGAGAWGAPASTLLLVFDPSRPPFDDAALRATAADALSRSDLAERVLPGAAPPAGLLPRHLWPPSSAHAEAAHARGAVPATPITLAVSSEVPPLVSQRLIAYLDNLGFRAGAVATTPDRALDAAAHARLLTWSPEVPEPELALRELAALAPDVPGVAAALAAAAREPDVSRRRSYLGEAEKALRASGVLVPLAAVPAAAQARANLHGVTTDRAGRLVLEDAWLSP